MLLNVSVERVLQEINLVYFRVTVFWMQINCPVDLHINETWNALTCEYTIASKSLTEIKKKGDIKIRQA